MELLILLLVVWASSFIFRGVAAQQIKLAKTEPCKLHKWEYEATEQRLKCTNCKQYPGEA